MRKICALLMSFALAIMSCNPVYGASMPEVETPNYKVAFYASPNYHVQDTDGRRSGYGYDMMQEIANHLQCTFSYKGYDKTPQECEEMLNNGQVDIYTAARKTKEREEKYAFSRHPAITASTCLNIKRGESRFVAGDYSTYNGMVVGLLQRHTYNDAFIEFAKQKNFECKIKYYTTPNELSEALIKGEVDALVDSYIRTPEDEVTLDSFGETPYYFMVRKENQNIVDQIDTAIDSMNLSSPNWRVDLYNKYYGVTSSNELTEEEKQYLKQLQDENVLIRGVMCPDFRPYSWYEDDKAYGIVADVFMKTADRLNLKCEIIPVANQEEYKELVEKGKVDLWLDAVDNYELYEPAKYKLTKAYFSTTLSVLRKSGSSGKINRIAVSYKNKEISRVITQNWPNAEVVICRNSDEYKKLLLSGEVDAVLTRSFKAELIVSEDARNRFRVDLVPDEILNIQMGVNAKRNYMFFSIWEKTLMDVSAEESANITQGYREHGEDLSLEGFMFRHPGYLVVFASSVLGIFFFICLWIQSTKRRKAQQIISEQLSDALIEAKESKKHLEEQYRLVEAMSRETHDGFLVDVERMMSTAIKVDGIVLNREDRKVRQYDATWDWYVDKYVHEEDREQLRKNVEIDKVLRALEESTEVSYRYRCINKGEIKYCQIKFTHVGDSDSKYLVFGICNIDELIRIEKEQQKNLEKAKDMAEAANKAKSTFLFNMSHDIRTPMNAIAGYTELILKHYDDREKCLDYTEKIRSSCDFLLSLINNVLEMARIESNKVVLDETPTDSHQIPEEVYAVYSELMKRKNIDFTMTIDGLDQDLYVDRVRLKEIFLNLVSNAYKYTQKGGKVQLSFRECPCDKEGYVMVEVIVSDTGIGMSEEFLPHLFEEFTRENNANDSSIKGTGLGMPIVKQLVTLMGGTITVESKLGKGTTFVVKIPHRIAHIEKETADNPVEIDTERFAGKRILLAEDNDLNAEIATEILHDVGFSVERATDGIVCVDMLQKSEPGYYDLILMDIQMPNLDGYGATRRIRASEEQEKANIPIVAMTANAFEEDKKNAFDAGMNGHLGKPIELQKLFATLAEILK